MAKSKHRKKLSRVKRPSWRESAAPTTRPPFALLPRPASNSWVTYVIVPVAEPGTALAEIQRTPAGSKGRYRVSFVLTVPGKEVFREDLNFPQIMESGDSLLWLGAGRQLVIENSDQPGRYAIGFSVNKHGRLATAHIGVLAENANDARRIAYDNIM